MSRLEDAPIIRSSSNQYLKLMRSLGSRKGRHSERAFLVEGMRLLMDAIDAEVGVRALVAREDIDREWLSRLGIPATVVHIVQSSLFDAASELEHSQGVAAILDMPQAPQPDRFDGDSLVIVDRVRDPGNLGTLLRSAAASNVDIVLTTPGTVDAYSPKVVRAGMGAHFRLPIGEYGDSWARTVQAADLQIITAEMEGACAYDNLDWSQPFALVIGGETEALSPSLAELPHQSVQIPMARRVESLNAGVAGSILMFEAARRRRKKPLIG